MKTVNVVAAIICHGGKIFCTQRGYGEFKDWLLADAGLIERLKGMANPESDRQGSVW